MKVYGSDICIDCRNFNHINKERGLNLEFIDITENTTNMREFLKIRDTAKEFEHVRSNHGIGIPIFVLDDKITLDINEAFSWINQPPVDDSEIIEWREA